MQYKSKNGKMQDSKCVTRVVIEEEGGKQHKLTKFGETVKHIADISKEVVGACDDVSDQLLMSQQLKYTISLKKEIVCSVARDL